MCRKRRAQRKAHEQARWQSILDEFESKFAATGIEPQRLAALFESGVLRRAVNQSDTARQLLQEVVQVLQALQAALRDQQKLCRAELSARALGDSHALDAGSALLLVMKHLHDLAGCDDCAFWNALGVIVDETSSTVLTLNLRFAGGALAPALNAFSAAGEPCRMTLKTIGRGLTSESDTIYICENPAILHAASTRLGVRAKPVICTEGQPSQACQKLLGLFATNGARFHYHGDFDWGGIKIANFIFRQFNAVHPWRFQAADYQQLSGGFDVDEFAGSVLRA